MFFKKIKLFLAIFLTVQCWCLAIVPFGGGDHDFHVSKCDIDYSVDENSLQITLHIFIDDLELALEKAGSDNLKLGTENEHPDTERRVEKYFSDHIHISVNEESITPKYLGKEVSEDLSAVWCYLEVTGLERPRIVSISNKLLLEIYDDQKNILSFKTQSGKSEFLLFQHGDTEKQFQLK